MLLSLRPNFPNILANLQRQFGLHRVASHLRSVHASGRFPLRQTVRGFIVRRSRRAKSLKTVRSGETLGGMSPFLSLHPEIPDHMGRTTI
jgi:hypothetical protein